MKIVFLNDLIYAYATGAPSAVGGAERQQWLLARALAAAGWQVTVGVRQPLEHKERVRIEAVEFVGIGQSQFLWTWYRFLVSEHPDWWYWRCASHLLGLAVMIARLAGVRMIFAVAFDTDVQIRHALYERTRWWPLYALGLLCADRIFVQTEKQLLGLPQSWRGKTWKVPSIAAEIQAAIPHLSREPYVAWVAMLRKFKRPDLLVEIARQAPDIRFIACGGPTSFTAEPGYGEKVAAALRSLPNVEYRGRVSPAEALQVMTDAGLFLSTSDEEGFPNTFLQAWSAGVPVVSLRVDPDQIIERHTLGRVSAHVEQSVADIRELINSPELRKTIGCRARAFVANNHGTAAVIKAFESAIRSVFSTIAVQSDIPKSSSTR